MVLLSGLAALFPGAAVFFSGVVVIDVSGGENKGFLLGVVGVGGGVNTANLLVPVPHFGGCWFKSAVGPFVTLPSSSTVATGCATLLSFPNLSLYDGGDVEVDNSVRVPSSYFTQWLKASSGLTRCRLLGCFLNELFNGGGLLFGALLLSEGPPVLFKGDGFFFLESVALPEQAGLSLALRLLMPLVWAIFVGRFTV